LKNFALEAKRKGLNRITYRGVSIDLTAFGPEICNAIFQMVLDCLPESMRSIGTQLKIAVSLLADKQVD
jgi:hypothetical protein